MSIASELTTLAANKASIKAAIVAKNPATAPTDALSQWPTAIASIPSGASLDGIIAAVEAMDGETHTGATSARLETAIKEITRKPDRRAAATAAPEPTYTPDEGKTAFVVRVYNDGERGLQFTIGGWTLKSGSSSVTVSWGDGSTETSTATGEVLLTHAYAAAGDYMVQISDDITYWFPHLKTPNGTNFGSVYGQRPQGAWSTVVDGGRTAGFWSVLNILKVHRALQWGNAITTAQQTYSGCSGLTGSIPAWGNAITNAQYTYYGCSGLTGSIPAWGNAITNAQETYRYCYGLDSVWQVEENGTTRPPTDAELMPSRITSKANCVSNTTDALRVYFLTAWGGSRAS